MSEIPHSRPWITDADVAAVTAVLRSGRLATGETRARFERAVAEGLGLDGPGVATASGRAAVASALRALEIGRGDEVIVPTYGCMSLAQAVAAVGATPVPCDAGPGWLMTPASVAPHVTPRTRAVVVAHLYGFFADTAACADLGVPVIEDFAQALPRPGERTVIGDIGICSFHPTKCLTTGEGGMVLCRRPDLARRVREAVLAPMSDLAAALGLAQWERYPEAVARRRDQARRYRRAFEATYPDALARHTQVDGPCYRFPISLPGGLPSCEAGFASRGVTVRRGVDHLVHRLLGAADGPFRCAVDLFETTVSLPIYPALGEEDLERCVAAVVAVCGQAAGLRSAAVGR